MPEFTGSATPLFLRAADCRRDSNTARVELTAKGCRAISPTLRRVQAVSGCVDAVPGRSRGTVRASRRRVAQLSWGTRQFDISYSTSSGRRAVIRLHGGNRESQARRSTMSCNPAVGRVRVSEQCRVRPLPNGFEPRRCTLRALTKASRCSEPPQGTEVVWSIRSSPLGGGASRPAPATQRARDDDIASDRATGRTSRPVALPDLRRSSTTPAGTRSRTLLTMLA